MYSLCLSCTGRRSTNSKHIIAEKSGHNIQFDQPDLVVESIRQVFAATMR
jgi:pimeloyl-ACP methyl ester carboxylesterase